MALRRTKSPLSVAFGQIVRERRRAADLSQERLAHLSGVDRTYLSKVERGLGTPSLRVVERLARALGESPHELIQAAENGLRRRRT